MSSDIESLQQYIPILKRESNILNVEIKETPLAIRQQIDFDSSLVVKITGNNSHSFNLILAKETYSQCKTTEILSLWNNYLAQSAKSDFCDSICAICDGLEPHYFLNPFSFILTEMREITPIDNINNQQQNLYNQLINLSYVHNVKIYNAVNFSNSVFVTCDVEHKNNPVVNTKISTIVPEEIYNSEESLEVFLQSIENYYEGEIKKQ